MGPEIKVGNKKSTVCGWGTLVLRFFKVVEEENSVGRNKSSAQGREAISDVKGRYFIHSLIVM